MAKTLFRKITSFIRKKNHPLSSNTEQDKEFKSKQRTRNNNIKIHEKQAEIIGTATVKDFKTGEYSQAEVIDESKSLGIEKSKVFPDLKNTQIDEVKLQAKNEAYLNAVKGLKNMNLDKDILDEAISELIDSYYGKDGLPDNFESTFNNEMPVNHKESIQSNTKEKM